MTTEEEILLLCDCLVEQPCIMQSTGMCYGRAPDGSCPAGTVACQPTGGTNAPSGVSTSTTAPVGQDCSAAACQLPTECTYGFQLLSAASGQWPDCCPTYECVEPTEVCFCPIEQPCLHPLALSCSGLTPTPFGGMVCPTGYRTCRVPEGNEVATFVSTGTFLADYSSTITSPTSKLIFSLTVRNGILDSDKSIAAGSLQTILVSEGSIVVMVHVADQDTKAKVDAVFAACMCVTFNGKELCTCEKKDVGIGSGAIDGTPEGSVVGASSGGGINLGLLTVLVGVLAVLVLIVLLAVGRRRKDKDRAATETASTYQSAMSVNAARAGYDDMSSTEPVYDAMKLGRQGSIQVNMTDSAAYDDVAKNLEAEYSAVTADPVAGPVYAQVNKKARYGEARQTSQPDPTYSAARRQLQDDDDDDVYGQARRASDDGSTYGLARDNADSALYGTARASATLLQTDEAMYGVAKPARQGGDVDQVSYGLAKNQVDGDQLYDLAGAQEHTYDLAIRRSDAAPGPVYDFAGSTSLPKKGRREPPVYDLAGRSAAAMALPSPAYDEVAEAMAMYDSLIDAQSDGGNPTYDELRASMIEHEYEDVYQLANAREADYDALAEERSAVDGDESYDNMCDNLLMSLRRDMSSEQVLRRGSFAEHRPPGLSHLRSEAALMLDYRDQHVDDLADN